jgi:hypothetical protein
MKVLGVGESIVFSSEDDVGVIRFGLLYEDYIGDGRNVYLISSQSFEHPANAEYTFWCPVQVDRT